MSHHRLQILQDKLQYHFTDPKLLEHALIHKSLCIHDHNKSNERMEFLGDAVLQLSVSTYLYEEYPDLPEGKMAKFRASLVCQTTLAEIARALELGEHIQLGKGEKLSQGSSKPSILSDALEAVFGAVYLDGGFTKASEVILTLFLPFFALHETGLMDTDYKTKLQEVLQKDGNVKIQYIITKQSGLPHDMNFYVDVFCDGEVIGSGQGKSKKNAEQSAAQAALAKLETE